MTNVQDGPFTELEDLGPGKVILSKNKISVVEGGSCDFYSVRLSRAPRADVLVEISDKSHQVRTAPKVLRFSADARDGEPGSWNVSQMVRVVAIDDDAVEDACETSSLTHFAMSGDYHFSSVNGDCETVPETFSVEIVDNDGGFVYICGELAEQRNATPTLQKLRRGGRTISAEIQNNGNKGNLSETDETSTQADPLSNEDNSKEEATYVSTGLEESVRAIACGESHMSVVMSDGRVLMIGNNKDGQLGLGDFSPRSEFQQWSGIDRDGALRSKIVQVSCGKGHTAIVSDDGRLLLAGRGEDGQLGFCDGRASGCADCRKMQEYDEKIRASQKRAAKRARKLEEQRRLNLLDEDAHALAEEEPLAQDVIRSKQSNEPSEVELKLFTFAPSAAALKAQRKRLSFSAKPGALETNTLCAVPRVVESLRQLHVERVACGDNHTVVLANQGTSSTTLGAVRCRIFGWGDNTSAALGAEAARFQKHPIELREMSALDPFQISCGGRHTAVLCGIGRLYTSGWGLNGCIGRRAQEDSADFVDFREVLFDHDKAKSETSSTRDGKRLFVNISSGYGHLGALCDDQQLYVCGDNESGQLGLGDNATRSKLTRVSFFKGQAVNSLAFGRFHSCATTNDGLYVWGSNDSGQLGLGTHTMGNSIPVLQLGVTEEIKQVHAGCKYSALILGGMIGRSAPASAGRKERKYEERVATFWDSKYQAERCKQRRRSVDVVPAVGAGRVERGQKTGQLRGASRVIHRVRKVDAALIRKQAAFFPYQTVTQFSPRITSAGMRVRRPQLSKNTKAIAARLHAAKKERERPGRRLVNSQRVEEIARQEQGLEENQVATADTVKPVSAVDMSAEELLLLSAISPKRLPKKKQPRKSLVENILLKRP